MGPCFGLAGLRGRDLQQAVGVVDLRDQFTGAHGLVVPGWQCLDVARYPHNWASRDAIFSKDFDGRFATGLDLLIAGVWQRIRSASTC